MTERAQLLNERVYAPYKIAALVEVLGEHGISAQQVLVGSGLKPDRIYDPAPTTSIRQFLVACENAIRLSRDPSVPFRIGKRLHLSSYGMYGYALLSSATVRDFLDSAVRYHALATPTLTMRWREEAGRAIWSYTDPTMGLRGPLERFLVELQFAQTVTHMQDVLGARCKPLGARTLQDAPPHAGIYRRHLGCPVEFGAPANELHYSAAYLEQRPRLAHRITSAMLARICEQSLADIAVSAGLAKRVVQLLLKTPGSFPGIEQVARDLHMTSRTLRRRLSSEGTSYQEILSDLRRSLAVRYLRTTRMSSDAIAHALGFSDAANFRHALKRWTNMTVRDVRTSPKAGSSFRLEAST